ncbi:MAG: alpha/beta hydrolase [Cyanobacteria bacterium P01_H01_bin.121]
MLVYLPGMDGTGQLFERQGRELQAYFDIRCLVIPTDDRRDWPTLTGDVIALVQQEQRSRQAQGATTDLSVQTYCCGESFGGCLALRATVQDPQLFHTIILVNPASAYHYQPWSPLSALALRWVPNSIYELTVEPFSFWLAARERLSVASQQTLVATMQSVPCQTAAWRLNLLNQFDTDALPLATIQQPVLLVSSRGDRLLPSYGEAIYLHRRLAKAKLHVLPESGHACLLEEEVSLANILATTGFLDNWQPTPQIAKAQPSANPTPLTA